MLAVHVALVSESKAADVRALTRVAAALQKQVTRDFSPIWGIAATVNAFTTLDDVPSGYWKVVVLDDIKTPGAAGVHQDRNGQPFALVRASASWALTASHEVLEMLADPFGNRLVGGRSSQDRQGRVEYLVEVCDACEDVAFSYTVNGVPVSDFITPQFFDPVASPGIRYSFTGSIGQPLQVLKGGYLSWHDPVSDHWLQERFFGDQAEVVDLGVLGELKGSLRSTIDAMTPVPFVELGLESTDPRLQAMVPHARAVGEAASSQAERLREEIRELVG